MILLPAMDLYDKKVVRLVKGDYKQMTVFSEDPAAKAREIEAAGASWLHMVDLEGAENGETPNFSVAAEAASSTKLKIEIGGGIRSREVIKKYLDAGVSRVILGTKAVTDPDFLRAAVDEFGPRIAVGVDIKDGKIAIRGWKETAATPVDQFFQDLADLGVKTVIVTDVSRDGMLQGANLDLYKRLARDYPIDLVASGGVSSLDDLKALRSMDLYGAILGKAMYTGAVPLADALKTAEGKEETEAAL